MQATDYDNEENKYTYIGEKKELFKNGSPIDTTNTTVQCINHNIYIGQKKYLALNEYIIELPDNSKDKERYKIVSSDD